MLTLSCGVRNADRPSGPSARAPFPGKRTCRRPSVACGRHSVFRQICPGLGESVPVTVSVPMRPEKGSLGSGRALGVDSAQGGGMSRVWALEAAAWAPSLSN